MLPRPPPFVLSGKTHHPNCVIERMMQHLNCVIDNGRMMIMMISHNLWSRSASCRGSCHYHDPNKPEAAVAIAINTASELLERPGFFLL
jgi:hypothetical protein